ncbi:MAG: TrkH family potassium uptake protein, partial [Planctomycetota bacterium]
LLGAVPFWLTGGIVDSYWDGLFESTSGLTTTGSSIFGSGGNSAISELPPSILFWRSWLHWIGGIGIVVMFLIFLPFLGISEKTLFQAEVAGVSKEGVKPRIRQSAAVLLRIYVAITMTLLLLYFAFGMNLFESICHAFATIATGGFSTRDFSLGEFNSDANTWGLGIELTAILGMLMAGTNFGLYHRAAQQLKKGAHKRWSARILGLPRQVLGVFMRDPEFRFYLTVYVLVVVILTLTLWTGGVTVDGAGSTGRIHNAGLGSCARDTSFQAASLISSTGFANCNLLSWPMLGQFLIMTIMFGGGCGGSTGGGLKMARVLMVLKLLARALRRFLRPRSVEPLRFGTETVDQDVIDRVLSLFVGWIAILMFGSILLIVFEPELDGLSAFSSILTALCNMGPGFTQLAGGVPANLGGHDVGSYGSFGFLSPTSKAMMSFVMILGRLEVFTLLVVFLPDFWRD